MRRAVGPYQGARQLGPKSSGSIPTGYGSLAGLSNFIGFDPDKSGGLAELESLFGGSGREEIHDAGDDPGPASLVTRAETGPVAFNAQGGRVTGALRHSMSLCADPFGY